MSNTTPWLDHYETGVAANITPHHLSSLVEMMALSAETYAQRTAFDCLGATLSFADVAQQANEFASYLQHHCGIKRGDRVAIMLPNVLQYPVAVLGALQVGAIVVNVNPLYTPRELYHLLDDSGAQVIVVLEQFTHVVESVLQPEASRTGVKIKQVITTSIGDMLGGIKGRVANFVLRYVRQAVPVWSIPKTLSFHQALSLGRQTAPLTVMLSLEDKAFLQYTGGTTGGSKAAILTHGNIVANVLQATEWIKNSVNRGEEIIITAIPLYHVFSLTANFFTFFSYGGKNVLIPNPRDMQGFVKTLSKHRFSVITGVNTLFNGLLNQPSFSRLDFSTLKVTFGGGMAVQHTVAEHWQNLTGGLIYEAYGLTETSPAACINPFNLKEFSGNIGLPISSTLMEVRLENGQVAPVGKAGELFIKGPQVMQGYWNKPELTASVLGTDGYFATGDIATMNEQGFFKLVDRKKDVIIVSGFNVYPNEIEDVVAMHPDVLEVACVGIANKQSGEVPKIFVVKRNQKLTEKVLIAHCRQGLTNYKVPRVVEFIDSLPKSNVGKILRKELR
ncbi:MAG: AMP-binding protein [Neisseriaceae bacterium]|nr:AMP-binding protein [Neisseriaceae bacterium]